MKSFQKMMEKKKASKMSPVEKDAKMNVLEDLRNHAMKAMGGKIKKVTVASDSKEGLEKGLDMAKEKVEEVESDEDESIESPEMESSEEECNTPEEIDEKIAELLKKKEELKKLQA